MEAVKSSINKGKLILDKLIENKDIDGYLSFVGVEADGVIKECEELNFECMCMNFDSPVQMLEYKMKRYLSIAARYSVDITKVFGR